MTSAPTRPAPLFSPLRAGVVFCVVVAIAAAAWYLPRAIGELHEEAAKHGGLSYADREFAGGNGLVVDQEALYQARARIPARSSYRVETGTALRTDNELTLPYIVTYAMYFLLPRRQDDDASWLICYGCDLARYGEQARVLWRNDEAGISIVRLVR